MNPYVMWLRKADRRGDRIGSSTNYTEFENTGFMEANGGAQAWNDIFLPVSSGRVPPANAPTWAAYSANLNGYTFDVGEYIYLSTQELPHDYAEDTAIEVHLHIITNGSEAADKYVKYKLTYVFGNMDGQMSAEKLVEMSADFMIPANTVDRKHMYIHMGYLTEEVSKIGKILKFRLDRVASAGTAPGAPPFVEMVGLHYRVNTLGSRQMAVK